MAQALSKGDIKELRDWYGLTQADFARAVGVSERAVIGCEGGDTHPMPVARRSLDLLDDLRLRLLKRFGESRAHTWLQAPNRALRGSAPRDVLLVSGPIPVRDLLVGDDAGTYR